MDNKIEVVGGPCGSHGPYTFYKAFKYRGSDGLVRIISLSEFFLVKLWSDSDLVCIGELQLLWQDKNLMQMLASLRLYFLPEHTPDGRKNHGEDEVLAISEKVVLRVEDLLTWISSTTEWNWGLSSVWSDNVPSPPPVKTEDDDDVLEQDPLTLPKDPLALATDPLEDNFVCPRRCAPALTDSVLDFTDVEKERLLLDESWRKGFGVLVLSYPRYCRYRALMKRLEDVEDKWLKNSLVQALGGFTSPCRRTRILFCKDTFDYPELEGHELLCNHLAPKIKGRPRGKRKKRSLSPGSESNESEASITFVKATTTNGLKSPSAPRRSTRCVQSTDEREFLHKLTSFMKSHRTPLGKIPTIAPNKELDLYKLWTKVQSLGGYDRVTASKLWKVIYEHLGGNQTSTSSATVIRRHYERLLLQYERKVRGEEHKPLPVSERRRLKGKAASAARSERDERGERADSVGSNASSTTSIASNSFSERTIQVKLTPPTTPTPVNLTPNTLDKVFTIPEKKSDGKTSSLRSVRVKTDRIRDPAKQDIKLIPTLPGPVPVAENIAPEPSPTENVVPEHPFPSASPTIVTSSPPTTPISIPSQSPAPPAPPSPIVTEEPAPTPPAPTSPASPVASPVVTPVTPTQATVPISLPSPSPAAAGDGTEVEEPIQTVPTSPVATVPPKEEPEPESDDDEPVEIPYKPDTPEIIDLADEDSQDTPAPPPPPPPVQDPKKRKLDIKIPGLEITPVPRMLPPPDTQYRKVTPPTPRMSSTPVLDTRGPPKVIQSRSIYSRSETTVYGNPKEPIPTIPRIGKSEVLDLRVKQQKPVLEIMRVPSVPSRNPYGFPLGSNLEITLVGNPKTPSPSHPKRSRSRPENGRHHTPTATHQQPRPKEKPTVSSTPLPPTPTKPQTQPSLFPNYLSQLSAVMAASSKTPFLPMLDPSLYYSALAQGLYPHNPFTSPVTPNMYPPRGQHPLGIPNPLAGASLGTQNPKPPTPEQLQLYKELMKDTSKLQLLFPMLQESSRGSITSSGSTPNN